VRQYCDSGTGVAVKARLVAALSYCDNCDTGKDY